LKTPTVRRWSGKPASADQQKAPMALKKKHRRWSLRVGKQS
jgi:hypothetical protein